jgi:LA2681-like HEPN
MPDGEECTPYEALMASSGIDDLSNQAALDRIGQLIDWSGDLTRDEGVERALAWCDLLEQRGLSNVEAVVLAYFRANAWGVRQSQKHTDPSAAWAWEQKELQEQILNLRRAVNHKGFDDLAPIRQCQILTNLANQLNSVGRFVEALEYWNRALGITPRFGMALGNRGYGLAEYARALYDPGHKGVFLRFAHQGLSAALSPEATYESPGYENAKRFFQRKREQIESVVDVQKISDSIELDNHELGSSKKERSYRRWCLYNGLFLNPLNDLGPYSIAGRDILMLPSFVTAIDEPPNLLGFFNQMKQEFVSARWLYYEGKDSTGVHFADREVALYNTLDYPSYSLAVEKIKATYRIAYSLFDKVAFFLNAYLSLRIDATKIYFRSVWYENADPRKRVIRPELERSENWPLRGLYWLAKDLYDDDFRDVTEPDAQALYKIRNHIEHSYLKIHEILVPPPTDPKSPGAWWTDQLAYSVQREDFEAKTLRLLKLARAALTYLSLAMHREERRRAAQKGEARTMPITLDLWEDDWKR